MKKAITTVHTIIVILGLLATAGWSVYYLYNQRQFNSENNTERIPGLVKEVSSAMVSSQSLYDKVFGENIKSLFSDNEDIIALSIYSYDTGIEYFYSRNGQIGVKNNNVDSLNKNPSYSGLSFSNSIGSTPLYLKDKPGTSIDFIFNVLPRTSVFYVLKMSLLAVIVLFVITLILIIFFSLSKEKTKADAVSDWNSQENGFDSSDDLDDSFDNLDNPVNDLDFDLPEEDISTDSDDFSMDDSLNLDDLDMEADESNFESDLSDDLNLEDSIPDIPDTEDLLGMDHEEMSSDQSLDNSDDDFDFPDDEDLFDDMSSEELNLDDLDSEEHDSSEPTLYNPDTGLGWESFLEERLGLELERSASFDQDLVLLMISKDSDSNSDMDEISAVVKDVYTYQDLIFEAGENGLALIEPNKDLDEAILDVQNLFKQMEQKIDISGLKCGLSSRNGRLITGKRLIKEADTSLNKSDSDNPIVGFRSDPERFREYLSSKS